MSEKLVWSNTMTQDYLMEMPENSLRAALVDYGYEADMLDQLDHDGLMDLVASDDYMWQMDSEDFEYNIAPEIEKQTYDGIVLLSGTAGSWQGNNNAGIACQVEDLIGGDICRDCDYIALYDESGNLRWEASHHDGTHYMNLYAIPEDKEQRKEFIRVCLPDLVEDAMGYNDEDAEWHIDGLADTLDIDQINDYCDFSKVSEVCEPIKALNNNPKHDFVGEDLEQPIEEAKSKNPENLAMELQSIKDDYEDFGPEGFYAVPFKRFAKQYPEFTKSCIKTYLKELEILEPEELEDPDIFEQYWQTGELIIPEDWPILLDGADRLSTDRADKGYTWITLLKKYNRPFDEPEENESLKEGLLDELFPGDDISFPTQDQVLVINGGQEDAIPAPIQDCTMTTASNVMAAYQNANKWLDIVKEIVYTNFGSVFFSSFIHNLAHTMPVRFDKFGDILHTINMRVPYPATQYIPSEPTNIDEVFGCLFMILDSIKIALNDFIKCTDETNHGMACAAEVLLNDIESEYPAIYRMQQEWVNSNGDLATFDKYVGQYIEHKDSLAEALNEADFMTAKDLSKKGRYYGANKHRNVYDKIANGEKLTPEEHEVAAKHDNYDPSTGGRRYKDESLEEDAQADELMKRYQADVKLHGTDGSETKRSADKWNAHLEKNKKVNEAKDILKPEEGQEFVITLDEVGPAARGFCGELEDYGYYQGDVILEDDDSQNKLAEIGAQAGDKIIMRAVYNDPEDVEMYNEPEWVLVVDRLA